MIKQILGTKEVDMKDYASERGQGILEYALIFMLVVIVVIIVLALVGPQVGNMFSNVIVQI